MNIIGTILGIFKIRRKIYNPYKQGNKIADLM